MSKNKEDVTSEQSLYLTNEDIISPISLDDQRDLINKICKSHLNLLQKSTDGQEITLVFYDVAKAETA